MSRLLLVVFAVLMASCSAPDDAAPDRAPYAVGSMTRFFHDDSRPFDAVAGINEGVRVLLTEIWYPVDPADVTASSRHPTHGDYVFGDRAQHRRLMRETVGAPLSPETARDGVTAAEIDAAIEALFRKPRASYIDLPLARGDVPFPVVVLSHGDAGSRYNVETVAEHLAAHGYIVIAPEHTGNASYVMTGRDPAWTDDPAFAAIMAPIKALHDDHGAYGDPANKGQSIPRNNAGGLGPEMLLTLDHLVMQRVRDVRFMLDVLADLNGDPFWHGAIDMDAVGIMGRSLGGATTLGALGLEPRFKSGVAVVAPSVADFRDQMPADLLVPEGEESMMFAAAGPFPFNDFRKPTYLISRAEDALIMTISRGLTAATGQPAPTAASPHPVLRQAYEASEAPVVWGMLKDGNHASLNVAGPYWWPHLKPNRLPRFFAPDTLFDLMPAARAHDYQAGTVLAFFDMTLRGDLTAIDRLLANPWRDAGVTIEARNLDAE